MHAIELDATLKLAKRTLREGKVLEAEAMYRRVFNSALEVHRLLGSGIGDEPVRLKDRVPAQILDFRENNSARRAS